MAEQLYSIKESTLTDISDALRRKHGETETITVDEQVKVISKTPNALSFDSFEGSYGATFCDVVNIPGAYKIKVNIYYDVMTTQVYPDKVQVISGEYNIDNYPTWQATSFENSGASELEFDGDTITFRLVSTTGGKELLGYYAECTGYVNEREVKRTYSSADVAQAIDDITVDHFMPESAYLITGVCNYRFANGGWDWFVNLFGDKVRTEKIRSGTYMFSEARGIKKIPFDLNYEASGNASLTNLFNGCENLENIPRINNVLIGDTSNMFYGCMRLRYLPDDIADWFDWSWQDSATSAYTGSRNAMFANCYSLRSIPIGFLEHVNKTSTYSYAYLNRGFTNCYVLDELVNLPLPYTATWTNNAFSSTFDLCRRLKNVTFETLDGVPLVKSWKSQIIDLSSVGVCYGLDVINNYNSGISEDKSVVNDEEYQALKNDPDWFALSVDYARYNHDSAVATINSLPDTSAYLATAGGTNTIKFKSIAGSATDGGAINTLTEAEIAVATAKGWTVTLV